MILLFPKSAVFVKIKAKFQENGVKSLGQSGECGLESKSYHFTWTPSTIPVATVIKIKKFETAFKLCI